MKAAFWLNKPNHKECLSGQIIHSASTMQTDDPVSHFKFHFSKLLVHNNHLTNRKNKSVLTIPCQITMVTDSPSCLPSGCSQPSSLLTGLQLFSWGHVVLGTPGVRVQLSAKSLSCRPAPAAPGSPGNVLEITFLGPKPRLVNWKLGRQGPESCVLPNSPDDSDPSRSWSWRACVLNQSRHLCSLCQCLDEAE